MLNTDIAALHDAIKSAFAARFPTAHVGYYERQHGTLPKSPAIFIHLGDMMPNSPQTDGDDNLELVIHCAAYLVVRYREPNAKRNLRVLAAEVMHFVRAKRWGITIGPAMLEGSFPDEMKPGEDGYEVFRVEWTHEARLSVESDPPPPPVMEVRVAVAPDVGPGNEPQYRTVFTTP